MHLEEQMQKRKSSPSISLLTAWLLFLSLFAPALAACRSDPEVEPTPDSVAEATGAIDAEVEQPTGDPVATPEAEGETPAALDTLPPPPTTTPRPTSTPVPATDTPEATSTPEDTATPESTPTETATPTRTASPTSPPQPTRPPATRPPAPPGPVDPATLGGNLLPNPSFEEGHYNQNGVAELQLPNGWRVEWDEGNTGFGNQVWDVYVRPETRVLSTAFLPPAEHPLFIFDGSHTVKIFKGAGAVSVRMLADVNLQPGTYVLEVQFFSDVYEGFENGQKLFSINPDAAETRLIAGAGATNWQRQNYGQKNVVTYTFTLNSAQTIPVGVALRGRYAIANNGWFLDNFSLRRVQ
jgi:hypothetical protein